MKTTKIASCVLIGGAILLALTGCGTSKDVPASAPTSSPSASAKASASPGGKASAAPSDKKGPAIPQGFLIPIPEGAQISSVNGDDAIGWTLYFDINKSVKDMADFYRKFIKDNSIEASDMGQETDVLLASTSALVGKAKISFGIEIQPPKPSRTDPSKAEVNIVYTPLK